MNISFTIPGAPCGKGRPRFSTAGKFPRAYTDDKTARYENLIVLCAQEEMRGLAPREGAVTVVINAYFPIPASWSAKKRQQAFDGVISPTIKPDADNICKAVCDSLNGIVYRDDSQVATLTVEKHYGATPRVEVEVFTNE
jgi:Holliday junction resolvase RusA-like endonuclease